MKVKFQLAQPLDIGNDGIELSLYTPEGSLVGKLTIGRATVKWRKRNARRDAEIRTETLIKLIEQHLVDSKALVTRPTSRQRAKPVTSPRAEVHKKTAVRA